MHSTPTRAAGALAAAAIAAAVLAGCAGGPDLKLNGAQVNDLDKSITALDAAWKQHISNSQVAATTSDESRCYAQVNDKTLADKALCGPVHYLGSDSTVWESVTWGAAQANGSKDQVTVQPGKDFQTDKPLANATLFRTDGKTAKTDAQLAEPDTKAAQPTQAIWADTNASLGDGKHTTVITPDGMLTLSSMKVSDRIGDAYSRVKAGDGNKFATVRIKFDRSAGGRYIDSSNSWDGTASQDSVKTTVEFMAGGKTYTLGNVKSGLVSMAVPGDGSDLALGVVYDGNTQTVNLADGTRHSTATAYYDGISSSPDGDTPKPDPLTIGDMGKAGFYIPFIATAPQAQRTAYDPAVGWAPEGKAWLKVTGSTSHQDYALWYPKDSTSDVSYYDVKLAPTSATAANLTGAAFTSPAKYLHGDTSGFGGTPFTAIFEVPSSATDFKVDYTITASGPTNKNLSIAPGSPDTFSQAYPVKNVQFTFKGNGPVS